MTNYGATYPFGAVGEFSATGQKSMLQVFHHQFGLGVEIIRRQDPALHIRGDLPRTNAMIEGTKYAVTIRATSMATACCRK